VTCNVFLHSYIGDAHSTGISSFRPHASSVVVVVVVIVVVVVVVAVTCDVFLHS